MLVEESHVAHRLNATVDENHELHVSLPADFPSGPAEVIVLAEQPSGRRLVRLGGVLSGGMTEPEGDPIAGVLDSLRKERADALDRRLAGLRDEPSGS
jgi:hypothetical protein